MKILKRIFLILFLIILLIYVTSINSIPQSILLLEGESLNIGTVLGVYINEKQGSYTAIQTSSNVGSSNQLKTKTADVSLFNIINIKEVKVSTIPKTTVIPLGNIIGLKLYTSGVLVVGKTEIEGIKPYEETGIKEGDMIVEIDEKIVTCTSDLIQFVNESKGEILEITYVRDGKSFSENISPAETSNKEYKLGLWVRDGAAGIGTMTYYEPETKQFAALGHGITDMDTKDLIKIATGEVITTTVSSIQKGEKEKPGQIRGGIIVGTTLGSISNNTEFGIYGNITNTTLINASNSNALEVATRDEIKKGSAKIILTLEDNIRKEYNIEITKIYKNNNIDNKSMLITVKDEELMNLTGGIIQGMSGAPIVQNGKFIGAVTHVLISDPTTGYAVFGDLMIKQMKNSNN